MNRNELLNTAVDSAQTMILECERWIWKHPETGWKEWQTSAYLEEKMRELGYALNKPDQIPGFYTDLDTGRKGPKICIMGELDSLICADHPECDPETKAVHACGHNAQAASLLGVAAALKQPGVLDGLCGSIRLMAVPAEELIEVGYREQLRQQGILHFFGGKVEFMYRGYFKDVSLCLLIHTFDDPGFQHIYQISEGNNGCIVKNIIYRGLASHAGSSPDKGINALYAAMQGLHAVNALRETFRDEAHIRFHPIITRGGQAVNAIPDEVHIESYVRGASLDDIREANIRINRALAASAASLGARIELQDRPGYCPLHNDPLFNETVKRAMERIVEPSEISISHHWGTGCTDMGDLSAVIPTVQAGVSGTIGTYHGYDFQISDPQRACVMSARALLFAVDELLKDGAAQAMKITAEARPLFPSQEAYLEAAEAMILDRQAVIYHDDGTITLDYQKAVK